MWLTCIIAFDIFVLWWLTSFVCAPIVPLLESLLGILPLPQGFLHLLLLVPNVLLVGLYLMTALPKSDVFKSLGVWEHFRKNMYAHGVSVHTNQVIYAIAPHGVHGEATILWFVLNRLYTHVVPVATSLLFWIPLVREFAFLGGAVPAKTAVISRLLDEGKSILIIPEGLRGALYEHDPLAVLEGRTQGENEPRKGFIRLALTNRNHKTLQIVPVWMEGVEHMYAKWNHPLLGWLQKLLLRHWLYPWPLLTWGRAFWPRTNRPLHIFFGEPIPLVTPRGASREVDDVFQDYLKAMQDLCAKGSSYNPDSARGRR